MTGKIHCGKEPSERTYTLEVYSGILRTGTMHACVIILYYSTSSILEFTLEVFLASFTIDIGHTHQYNINVIILMYKKPKGSKIASNYAILAVCSISHLPGHMTLAHWPIPLQIYGT